MGRLKQFNPGQLAAMELGTRKGANLDLKIMKQVSDMATKAVSPVVPDKLKGGGKGGGKGPPVPESPAGKEMEEASSTSSKAGQVGEQIAASHDAVQQGEKQGEEAPKEKFNESFAKKQGEAMESEVKTQPPVSSNPLAGVDLQKMGQNFMGGFSDRRLKKNIKLIGYSPSGLKIYMFEYINKIFGDGIYQGVMSDEIPQQAVIKHSNGYDRVNYSKIDVKFKELINK